MPDDELRSIIGKLDNLLERTDTMAETLATHDRILFGREGMLGLAQQVNVLWRIHVWLLCSMSAGLGSLCTGVLMYWFNRG